MKQKTEKQKEIYESWFFKSNKTNKPLDKLIRKKRITVSGMREVINLQTAQLEKDGKETL